jgi:hypothetical protein
MTVTVRGLPVRAVEAKKDRNSSRPKGGACYWAICRFYGGLNPGQHSLVMRQYLSDVLQLGTGDLADTSPVDRQGLTGVFFESAGLTLISLGEYLTGDLEPYRDEIREFIVPHEVNLAS